MSTKKLERYWRDGYWEEADAMLMDQILAEKPSYVDFFIDKLDKHSDSSFSYETVLDDVTTFVITVIPLDVCLEYYLNSEPFDINDYKNFHWYQKNGLTPMSREEYKEWLTTQKIIDGRNKDD